MDYTRNRRKTDGNENTVKESTEDRQVYEHVEELTEDRQKYENNKILRSDVGLSMGPSPWSHFDLLI